MFYPVDLSKQLQNVRRKTRTRQEELVSEARRILRDDLFTDRKILANLARYEKRFETLDEEEMDGSQVFSLDEIRTIATRHRLKFLESGLYKPEMPYEAVLRIKDLNQRFSKELKHFSVLSYPEAFRSAGCTCAALLFARTNHDNYYLIQRWGKKTPWTRQLTYWPLRSFETLLCTLITFTLLLTLALPTDLITLDPKAGYWSGYRAAAFFHLLIFNGGITIYLAFAFSRNFSSTVWNRKRDFD